jgi:putative endonuclease
VFNTQTLGKKAETAAKEFLIQQGLSIVEENYYCRQGEIDLIMRDDKQLVFVEVKYRRNTRHGSGADAVSFHKQQKIIYAARHYLHKHNLTETCSSRFDIASMSPANTLTTTTPFTIHWLKNAFY